MRISDGSSDVCSSDLQEVCFLIQEVMEEDSRRPLLKITVGFFGAERQLRAIIAMPLGVPLATGIQISVDGQAIGTVPFDLCRRDGCLAVLLLTDKIGSAACGERECPYV